MRPGLAFRLLRQANPAYPLLFFAFLSLGVLRNPVTTVASQEKGEAGRVGSEVSRPIRDFNVEGEMVRDLGFTPDGRTLAVAVDRSLYFFDWATGREVDRWSQSNEYISRVAYTAHGKVVIVASGTNRTIHLREAKTGREFGVLDLGDSALTANGLAVSPGAGPIVTATGSEVVCWRVGERVAAWRLTADRKNLDAIALTPDDRLVAVGTDRGEVRLVGAIDGREMAAVARESQFLPVLRGMVFSPGGAALALGERGDGQSGSTPMRVLDGRDLSAKAKLTWTPKGVRPRGGPSGVGIAAATFSPDGKTLALLCNDGAIRFYETLLWSLRHELHVHGICFAFSRDGRHLIIGGSGAASARVYDWRGLPPPPRRQATGGGVGRTRFPGRCGRSPCHRCTGCLTGPRRPTHPRAGASCPPAGRGRVAPPGQRTGPPSLRNPGEGRVGTGRSGGCR